MSYPNIGEFLEDFEQHSQLLGQGTYGEVYKMKTKRIINQEIEQIQKDQKYEGQDFAVKMMNAKTEKSFQIIQKEFLILKSLPKQHPNIITLYKCYAWAKQVPDKTYTLALAMELADRSLMAEIQERRKTQQFISDENLYHIFLQCIQTLNDIKEQSQIFHRDIKPENIMLNKNGLQIKITDFGVSRKMIKEILPTLAGTLVGTPAYLSPILWEAFEKGGCQIKKINKITHNLEKSDVYSLGVTLLQTVLLLTTEIQSLNTNSNGEIKTMELLKKINNDRFQKLLSKMLVHDERKRANYQELLTLLQDPIYKQKKLIFQHLEPKIGIKEQFNLQAKIQFQQETMKRLQSQELEQQQNQSVEQTDQNILNIEDTLKQNQKEIEEQNNQIQ